MRGQPGFWDVDERYVRLSEAGDPLEKLNAIVPWEIFGKPLSKALKRSDGAKGGRPPYDAVLMFKILVLQALYNLSDDQAEFQIQDRLSFMRFLGLAIAEKVPDAKTIWTPRKTSPFGSFHDSILISESRRLACGDSRGSGTSTSGMFV